MTQKGDRRYGSVPAEKAAGATYTPPELADFVAQQLADLATRCFPDDTELRVLDPAVGDGALLASLHHELRLRGFQRVAMWGFEIDPLALRGAAQRLAELDAHWQVLKHDFLAEDGLGPALRELAPERFDLVIANPPYVRTQILGSERARVLAREHGLKGRVDLYQAFLMRLEGVLVPGGAAAIITSNRYLAIRSGEAVREWLWSRFRIHHVWDLGDTKLFEAAVLPAVTLLERQREPSSDPPAPAMTTIYTCDEVAARRAASPIVALADEGPVEVPDGRTFRVRHGSLVRDEGAAAVWRLENEATRRWLGAVAERTWRTFSQVGRIRVGIKTTADRVFIRDDWDAWPEDERPELLRPLTTHHVGRRYRPLPHRKQVLYPHQVKDGRRRAADLADHPRAAHYLAQHRDRLGGRDYVRKAGREWYEIWVPHDPARWSRPKLVFRDITDRPCFWIDRHGTVVNGDCYWMVLDEGVDEDVLWLAVAVGNSSFVEDFYDRRFLNKLYAGRRRFITQYVNEFPLPDPESDDARRIVALAKRAWDAAGSATLESLERRLDELVRGALVG